MLADLVVKWRHNYFIIATMLKLVAVACISRWLLS